MVRKTLSAVLIVAAASFAVVGARSTVSSASPAASATCQLNGQVKHVVYLQFDNTHYMRDAPSVASDLEQMPHLLNFLKSNGTLFTNDHTILISHTAGGILSTQTGLYPDRHGITVSNSYWYFDPSHNPEAVSDNPAGGGDPPYTPGPEYGDHGCLDCTG